MRRFPYASTRSVRSTGTGTRRWRPSQTRKPRVLLSRFPEGTIILPGAGPTKQRFPTFQLPDVVLDLDAEDNPHVRPYDQETDGPLQDSQWGYDPIVDEARRQAREENSRLERNSYYLKQAVARPFKSRHMSEHDLMMVTLLGGSSVFDICKAPSLALRSDRRKASLWFALGWSGIPLPIVKLEANKVIPFMLQRLRLVADALKDKSRRSPEEADDDDTFKKRLAECKNLYQLRKLCSRIDNASSGIELGADSTNEIYKTLSTFWRHGVSTAEETLRFVNNMFIKRLTSGKELNRSMALLGVQLSTAIGLLPCILQHLQICLSLGIIDEAIEKTSPARIQIARSILAALERGDVTGRGVREQIFTLTTGRRSTDLPPSRSLLGLFPKDHTEDPAVFNLRVQLLGELGAVRLLWHQWRGPDYQVFIMAFRRCAQILASAGAAGSDVNITTVTGDVEKDAALDLRTINALEAIHTAKGSKLPRPYVTSSKEGVLSEGSSLSLSADDITSAFNQPIMSQAMARLRVLVVKAAKQEKPASTQEPTP